MRPNLSVFRAGAVLLWGLIGGLGTTANAAPELMKRASYGTGLIDSYQFRDGDIKLIVSPILINSLTVDNYSYTLRSVSSPRNLGIILGNAEGFGEHHGTPNGATRVPTITGATTPLNFQIGEAAMVFYKDHQGTWRVGPSSQLAMLTEPMDTAAGMLAEVTDQQTINTLDTAKEIYAGHYVLTAGGELRELIFGWTTGKFNSLFTRITLPDVSHVRAASASTLLAFTKDNQVYRIIMNVAEPQLIGPVSADLVEAAKKTASINPDDGTVVIEHNGSLKSLTGQTVQITNGSNPITFAGEDYFYIQTLTGTNSTLHRTTGGTVSSVHHLDRQGYPLPALTVEVQSQSEAMISPYTVMGLNADGLPYIRGIVGRKNTGQHTTPSYYFGVADNFILDTGTLYLTQLRASKGQDPDKITATWWSNGTTFTVSPKACDRGGANCQTVGAAATVTENRFVHTVADGIDPTITHGSQRRMFYGVSSSRTLGIYASAASTTFGVAREGKDGTTDGGYLASPPTATSATLTTNSNSENVNLNVTTVDPDEANNHQFEILTQAAHGVATVGTDGLLKYSVANYYGPDTFTYRIRDGGGFVDGTATITVNCPAPEIVKITPPAKFVAWQSNVFTIQYRANACNGPQLDLKITAGSGSTAEIERYTKVVPVINNGGVQTATANFADPDAGTFNVTLSLASQSVAGNKAAVSNTYEVVGLSTPTITLDNSVPTEDQLITATVGFPNNDCPMYLTQEEAAANLGCYVTWSDAFLAPSTSVKNGKSILAGYGPVGGPYQLVAEVFKIDSTRTPRLVTSLGTSFNVTPGEAIEFKNPSFEESQRQYLDFVSFAVAPVQADKCVVTTSESQATAEAAAGKRVCLVEYTTLPAGLALVGDGSTKVNGRLTQADAAARVEYTVSKFYTNRPSGLIATNSFDIPVQATAFNGQLTFDRPEYARGLQIATATASITGTPTCTISNSSVEAKNSYAKAMPLICLGEWNNLPSWLTMKVGNKLVASGTVPVTPGEYPLSYTLYMVDSADHKTALGTFEAKIKVVDLPDIELNLEPAGATLHSPEGGLIYTTTSNGRIGTLSVNAGNFTTVRSTTTIGSNVPIVMSGIGPGTKRDLVISNSNSPAWELRTASIKLEYEGIADTTKTTTRDITITQLPPVSSMSALIERPTQPLVDSQPFALKGAIGIPAGYGTLNYSETSQGRWTAYLASQEADGFIPITDPAPMETGGRFTFENLTYQAIIGRSLVMVAEAVPPAGIVIDAPIQVASGVTRIDFVSGSPIYGNVMVDKSKGIAPLNARFAVQVSQQDGQNLGVTIWEISYDEGTTWNKLDGLMGNGISYTFKEGGRYMMRARLINKHSGATSYTDPALITVTEVLRISIAGNDRQIPGTPLVLTAEAKRPDGSSNDIDIEWVLKDSNGEAQTRSGLSDITLESAGAATYEIVVRAKPSKMNPDQAESWSTAKKTVTFAWPTPVRVAISGPRRIDVGIPTAISGKTSSKDATANSGLIIKSAWTLPEGVTTEDSLDAAAINITVAPERFSDGDTVEIGYRGWIEGAREATEASTTHTMQVTKYEFATFAINKRSESATAPGYLRLQVIPASTAERRKIGTQKIQYTWSVPDGEGVVAKVSANMLTLTTATPGEFPITVTVADQIGNTQELSYRYVVGEPPEHTVSLGLREGLKVNRAPMTYTLRPTVSGGQKSDKVTQYELFLNDSPVMVTAGNRPPRTLVIPNAGEHSVRLKINSSMNKTAQAEELVTVNPNQAPQCEPLTITWDRKGTSASIQSHCVDADGRIKGYRWSLNGEVLEKRVGNRLSLNPDMIGGSAELVMEVFDDSGDTTEQRVTLTPPGPTQ